LWKKVEKTIVFAESVELVYGAKIKKESIKSDEKFCWKKDFHNP
jgi:hypothetical protein